MRDYLRTKGVHFELLLVPRLHQRRCLFTGATGILEISTEWGLDFFLDSPENFQRAPHLRTTLRTEVMVWRHEVPRDAETLATPTAPGMTSLLDAEGMEPGRHAALAHVLRRLLYVGRKRSWAGRIACLRCSMVRPAEGAVVRFSGGRVGTARVGGPCVAGCARVRLR